MAAPTTGRAGFAFPSVCWEPSTPPLLFERELLCAAAFPATAACAVTLAEPETVAEVPAEPVAVVEAAAHELALCAFSACTSNVGFAPGHTGLWGWLLPGPYRLVVALAPFCMAICPAVLPLPYSLVWVEPAMAFVFFPVALVVELGFTPAVLETWTDAEPLACVFACVVA